MNRKAGKEKTLQILHFNDVYDIEENKLIEGTEAVELKQIRAGASRFRTAWKQHGSKDALCLFSGDLFSPSLCKFSTIFDSLILVSANFRGQ